MNLDYRQTECCENVAQQYTTLPHLQFLTLLEKLRRKAEAARKVRIVSGDRRHGVAAGVIAVSLVAAARRDEALG
eukprot:584569-Hanusia_phi.AAC.1